MGLRGEGKEDQAHHVRLTGMNDTGGEENEKKVCSGDILGRN